MVNAARFEKTSVQLPPDMMRDMDAWPGLTRSEAIRLAVERAHYFSTLRAEEMSCLATHYKPILSAALEDFGYEDYRAAARALPAIVSGFLRENPNLTWKDEVSRRDLDGSELIEKLEQLHPVDRIGVLDCVVAERLRGSSPTVGKSYRRGKRPVRS